jgi:hypothetical protein
MAPPVVLPPDAAFALATPIRYVRNLDKASTRLGSSMLELRLGTRGAWRTINVGGSSQRAVRLAPYDYSNSFKHAYAAAIYSNDQGGFDNATQRTRLIGNLNEIAEKWLKSPLQDSLQWLRGRPLTSRNHKFYETQKDLINNEVGISVGNWLAQNGRSKREIPAILDFLEQNNFLARIAERPSGNRETLGLVFSGTYYGFDPVTGQVVTSLNSLTGVPATINGFLDSIKR